MIPLMSALMIASTGAAGEGVPPTPRVAGTYSSWLEGAYTYRDSLDALYEELGWPYVRVENRHVGGLTADLDRYDIFCPPALYNYSDPQPFEAHAEAWTRFLERGGILFAVDANYGQQLTWVSRLGPGLELASHQCAEAMTDAKGKHPTRVTADDPFAAVESVALPWAHFDSWGPSWEVLATCPEGKPIMLKTRIGNGVLVATNLYSDAGFPTAEYLKRVWEAHWPTAMDAGAVAAFDPGRKGIGRNTLTVGVDGTKLGTGTNFGRRKLVPVPNFVFREVQAQGGAWTSQTVPLAQAATSVPYSVGPGRTDVRVVVRQGERPIWWTSFTCRQADVPGLCEALNAKLAPHTEMIAKLGPHPLRDWYSSLTVKTEDMRKQAEGLVSKDASEETQREWDLTAEFLGALNREATWLAGRLTVLEAYPDAISKRFVVVPARPLDKLLRDEPPPCGGMGEATASTANRGQSSTPRGGVGTVPTSPR
ncbi:MAG: hypothetical protein FJX75_21400 [Armatimonadetes bacterium]|nr:hypothetical protein [Armatimonadota bacterium]